jgi:hypothetical protein
MSNAVRIRPMVGAVASVWKVVGRVRIAAQVCVMGQVWPRLSTVSTKRGHTACQARATMTWGSSSMTMRNVWTEPRSFSDRTHSICRMRASGSSQAV